MPETHDEMLGSERPVLGEKRDIKKALDGQAVSTEVTGEGSSGEVATREVLQGV